MSPFSAAAAPVTQQRELLQVPSETVVIEGGEEVGGLCILRGCMPTKALLYAAEVMHLASHPNRGEFAPGKWASISKR